MNPKKRKALEEAGWRYGDAAQFLDATKSEAMTSEMPVRRGPAVMAFVRGGITNGSRVLGKLIPGPDFAPYRPLFEQAVEAFGRVDAAGDEDYQAAWQAWHRCLKAIEQLGLVFGEQCVPIEDFEMDDQWQVEFSAAFWWQVERELRDDIV
jgi:hypothetical protein